jgi:hypothetical protein
MPHSKPTGLTRPIAFFLPHTRPILGLGFEPAITPATYIHVRAFAFLGAYLDSLRNLHAVMHVALRR